MRTITWMVCNQECMLENEKKKCFYLETCFYSERYLFVTFQIILRLHPRNISMVDDYVRLFRKEMKFRRVVKVK